MTFRVGLFGVVLWSSVAMAKPLPDGMKISLQDDKLYVQYRGVRVSLRGAEADDRDPASSFDGAELSSDGTKLLLKANTCMRMGNDPDEPFEIALTGVEARVENALGMQLHVKKKFVEAIPHFAAAAKLDPETPVYATNLLSAQALAKQLDEADRTLAAYGPGHIAWFAWRLAADPELASLRGRPSTRPLAAAKPSKLTWKGLHAVAVSPLGMVAAPEWTMFGGPGAPSGSDLVIYDPRTSAVLLRLSAEGGCGGPVAPCTSQDRAWTAAHTREASLVLAALGFEDRAAITLESSDDGKFASQDKRVTAELTSGEHPSLVIHRGKAVTTVPNIDPPGDVKAIELAGNLAVLKLRQNGFSGCSGDAQRSYSVFYALP